MIEENETYHGSCLSNAVKCSSSVTKINATSFKQSTMNIVEHSPFAKKPRHITIKDGSDSSVTPFHKKENKGRLSLFSNNYNALVDKIKNIKKEQHASKTPILGNRHISQFKQMNLYCRCNTGSCEDNVLKLTNTERVSDFYEYTEECMRKIQKLPKEKPNVLKKVTIPIENNKKKIALLDLDETLVHCNGKITDENKAQSQHIVEVTLSMGKKVKIGINIRPHYKTSLDMIKEHYTLVLYTASHQSYTDAVLALIDPNKEYFSYRLYRNNCIPMKIEGKDFFIKDLSIIENSSLENIVIVDNSVLSFAYHIDNGIPIVPYYEGEEDSELPILAYYLSSISKYSDVREANKMYIKLSGYLDSSLPSSQSNTDDEETFKSNVDVKGIKIIKEVKRKDNSMILSFKEHIKGLKTRITIEKM